MQSIPQLTTAVGEWSNRNFGQQESKAHTIDVGIASGIANHFMLPVPLGSLAPLLGMAEELGELAASGSYADKVDAVGDIMIYAMDFAFREGVEIPWGSTSTVAYNEALMPQGPLEGLVVWLGHLNHAVLKHHQGIRGMDDPDKYNMAIRHSLDWFMVNLCRWVNANLPDKNPLEIVNDTWGIVSQRDWAKDKDGGGGHAHVQDPIAEDGSLPTPSGASTFVAMVLPATAQDIAAAMDLTNKDNEPDATS